jgi:hypothetical protein
VKKSKLETPALIDHDFNYLTSIERGIDDAAQTAEISGKSFKVKPEMRRRMAEMRVTVDRAPAGMSRQRMNKTHWDGT